MCYVLALSCVYTCIYIVCVTVLSVASTRVHGKYVYSTLALGKEREIMKEETSTFSLEYSCDRVHYRPSGLRQYMPSGTTCPQVSCL